MPEIISIDPTQDPLEQIARSIEAEAERKGWDQKPVFYAIAWEESIPGIPTLTVAEIGLPEAVYDNPAVGLGEAVRFLKEAAKESPGFVVKRLDIVVPEGFQAIALVYEGWALPDTVPQEEALAVFHNHLVHLHPHRIEERICTIVDVNGRIVNLNRQRGDEGEPTYNTNTDDGVEFGRLVDGLRDLCSLFRQFNLARLMAKVLQEKMRARQN
jgi:hypothetical protein